MAFVSSVNPVAVSNAFLASRGRKKEKPFSLKFLEKARSEWSRAACLSLSVQRDAALTASLLPAVAHCSDLPVLMFVSGVLAHA